MRSSLTPLCTKRKAVPPDDYNGNTVSKADTAGTTQYAWDFENRLTQVTLPDTGNGAQVVTFKYDPFGRRIQKSGPSGITDYLYDGSNLLEEVDSSGNVLARYTQGTGPDQPLTELRFGTSSYFQQDAIGSVTSLSNGSGALANTYTYDSFGNLTASTGSITNPFQYTGREFDQETGRYFYRARYHDPIAGRFVSEDPIQFTGGMNFYAYAANNPVSFVDPLGLTPSCVMTNAGLVCNNNDPVKDRIDSLQGLFPGSQLSGGSGLVIPMSCDKVKQLLMDSGYYTGGLFSAGNWTSQNPFLFWNPVDHRGGSEFRDRFGFHLRMKYSKCDQECTVDQFHIDSSNPLYDSWEHFVNDFVPSIGNKVRGLFGR